MAEILKLDDVLSHLKKYSHPSRDSYLAMYSSWFGGIIKEANFMMVPIDDHIVHRGDGVFEAIKGLNGKIFGLRAHLERLERSAKSIFLTLPKSIDEIEKLCLETVRAAGAPDVLIRLYVSRGPGGFTTNPYEVIANQIYIVVTKFRAISEEKYLNGVSVKVSEISVKEGIFATVKSCNYLPNVLMKKEAVDHGVDFTVSEDEEGNLAEGSTENFAIISKDGEFIVPGFTRTLKGVTAVRCMELAKSLVERGMLKGIKNGHITKEDVFEAREAMMLGTTLDCLPVSVFEGRQIGNGKREVCAEILKLLRADMNSGPLVTQV